MSWRTFRTLLVGFGPNSVLALTAQNAGRGNAPLAGKDGERALEQLLG